MATQLVDVVKGPHCLIVCGKLVRINDRIAYIDLKGRKNKPVVYTIGTGGSKEVVEVSIDSLIKKELTEFVKKYDIFINSEEDYEITVQRDNFLKAYVATVNLYWRLADSRNYEVEKQYSPEAEVLVESFILEQLFGYYDIYCQRINRKLMSSGMPVKIKAHLREGLFQPVVATTTHMVCPMRWGIFNRVFYPLQSSEVVLENFAFSKRGLELICIAMADFCETKRVDLVVQMDRRFFIGCLCLLCSALVHQDGPRLFMRTFPRFYDEYVGREKSGVFLGSLLSNMANGV